MGYAFGTGGPAPASAGLKLAPKAGPQFPAVGSGLGGMPVRKTIPEVAYFVFYTTGLLTCDVFDKDFRRITNDKITTQPTCSASGSMEQMWMNPRQKRYLAFGSYCIGTGTNGSVVDMSTTPWTAYNDYSAITDDGTGNSIVRNAATVGNYVALFNQDTTGEEAVCPIASPLSEINGQPTSFVNQTGDGCYKAYGLSLYTLRSNGLYKYTVNPLSGVLTESASNVTLTASGYNNSIAVSSDDKFVYCVNGTTLYKLDPSLAVLASLSLASFGSAGFNACEALEISPDNKWLLVGGNATNDGTVLIVNSDLNQALRQAVPTGTTNARFVGCAWLPDSDGYIVSGYSGARTFYGRRTASGVIKNLYADLFNSTGSTHGVAVVTK